MGTKETNSLSEETKKHKANIFRIILGTIVAWFFYGLCAFLLLWAYGVDLYGNGTAIPNWILTVVVVVLIYLFVYGILGKWLSNLDNAKNKLLRILCKWLGFFGLILRPYVLMAYGANKKTIYVCTVVLPAIVLMILGAIEFATGQVFKPLGEVLGVTGGLNGFGLCIVFLSIYHIIIAATVKKCPQCNCIMSKIDVELLEYKSETYTRDTSVSVGSISFDDGESVDLRQRVAVGFEGHRSKEAKTYTCQACGCKLQGKAYSYLSKSREDWMDTE